MAMLRNGCQYVYDKFVTRTSRLRDVRAVAIHIAVSKLVRTQ